jgi:uncharacterized membrane protein YkoI
MDRKRKWIVGIGLATAVPGVVAGVAVANDRGEVDGRLTDVAQDRAIEAALAHLGGGTVLETEVGDDRAAYSVEIRTLEGSVVEVQLDASFQIVGTESDHDEIDQESDQ